LSMTGLAASASAPPFSLDDGIPTAPPKFASGPALTIDTSSDRESRDISPDMPTTPLPDDNPAPPKHRAAWWLDVSCPTWKDLRDIGELLGLHPLTLEDVLHQDPREKFEMYSKLGYYFIVVRALDEQYFKYTPGSSGPPGADLAAAAAAAARQAAAADGNGKQKPGSGTGDGTAPDLVTGHHDAAKRKERTRRGWGFGRATGRAASKVGEKVEIVEDNPGKEGLEGVGVGGVNLYLVVFADGIVSVSRLLGCDDLQMSR
jgi:Mg2+ and Co2+ transporter CorA